MDLRSLRYCEAVARLGSFTKASSELRIAQPALSVAIKKLEEELGVTLFLRHARQVVATPEADLLLKRATDSSRRSRSRKRRFKRQRT
jgi:LysR family cyn operon transcriptional activator